MAALLQPVIPAGFRVEALAGTLLVSYFGRGGVGIHLASVISQDPSDHDVLLSGTLSALSTVQDFISESTGEPWPSDDSAGVRKFAEPKTRIDGSRLVLWFADSDRVTMSVGTIDLDE